jgi:uncharacterized protein YlxW (UPF0749 family)
MKKFLVIFLCILILVLTGFFGAQVMKANAGDITGTGVSQADLVAVITALTNAVNELKTDVNALEAALDASFTTVAGTDNTAALDNTLSSSHPVTFTTIVLSPRAGY